MDDARLIPADHLHAFVVRVIERVGTPTDIARVVATTIVNADLSGHPSHGVAMIPHYLAALEDGRLAPAARPVIVQELPGSAVIDAQGGWGHYTAAWTMDWLIEKARGVGVACASIRDVKHIGRFGEYAQQAA
ncbi:malate/lactate/ureidoglycolate dehydrogenase, partial [Candidatus Poribacteria bacterium]|nr:malate/lactate/ureidoglycolate dehydrogenase [Candidatus Poribacteria bacterium]